jgi:hypothetical protein
MTAAYALAADFATIDLPIKFIHAPIQSLPCNQLFYQFTCRQGFEGCKSPVSHVERNLTSSHLLLEAISQPAF